MQFRNQSFFAHVFNLAVQVFVATVFSIANGTYWLWICPALFLFSMPMARKRSWVVVDDDGVRVGGKTSLLWAEIESLAERRWARAVFVLKDGERKSLWTTDWPTEHKEEFYSLLKKRGLCHPAICQGDGQSQ